MWYARFTAVALYAALSLAAQPPAIGQNGVVNTASQIPPTLSGGAIAPGASITVYGVRLITPHHLASVTLVHGNARNPLRVVAARPTRIDALVPEAVPLGTAVLVVTTVGGSSNAFPVEVVSSNPGLFSRNGLGWGPGQVENIASSGARSENSQQTPARPGQRVSLLATGMGSRRHVDLVVGDRLIQTGSRQPAGRQGEEEIAFQIPANAPEGCYVPVYLLAGPARASNVVTISIRSKPGSCEPGPIPLLSANRIGIGVLSRNKMRSRTGDLDITNDEAIVSFVEKNNTPVLSPLLLLPPPGTCTAYSSSFQAATVLPNSVSAALVSELGDHGLDAGPRLRVRRDAEVREIPEDPGGRGFYRVHLGSSERRGGPRSLGLFLESGTYRIAGTGGQDVGAFDASIAFPSSFDWTDRDQTSVIDRSRGFTVHWNGVSDDRVVVILATNVDQITTATAMCLCTAHAREGRMTIVPSLLANFPESKDMPGVPYDQLFVATLPAGHAAPILAAHLSGGAIITLYASGRFVTYR